MASGAAAPDVVRLRELPAEERPRERLMQHGPAQLTNTELLALLIRTGCSGASALGVAQNLLAEQGGLLGCAQCTWRDFTRLKGIGPAKALHLVAACELGKRIAHSFAEEKPLFSSAAAVVKLVQAELRFMKQEHFLCLYLDARYRLLLQRSLFKGSVDATLVHPRDIFREAVQCNAVQVICVHNHPSGDPEPSCEDLLLTHRLQAAGDLLGIPLFDHIVVGDQSYVSLRERGTIT